MKATQPILDIGRLHQALSNVKEYHDKLTARYQDDVASCEKVISDGQATLAKVKKEQADHKEKAAKEISEIQTLIKKKQETQDVLAPRAPAPPQDQPDQHLMMQATQQCLVNQACPHHIKFLLMNHWNSGPAVAAQPTQPIAPTPSGTEAELGGANAQQAAAWEAA